MAEGSWIRLGPVKAGLKATTLNALIKDTLGKRMISITQAPTVRKDIGEALVSAVTPLVPVKSGRLSEQGHATDDGRVYWTATNKGYNYAYNVYDPENERWSDPPSKYANPSKNKDARPRWVEVMIHEHTPEYDVFLNEARRIIIEAHNRGLI